MSDVERYDGVWWFPEKPNERYSGSLTFDSFNGGVLELRPARAPARKATGQESYDVIHGQIGTGQDVTVAGCLDMGQVHAFRSTRPVEDDIVSWRIHADLLFLGFLLPSYAGDHITNLTTSFRHLYRWMALSGATLDHGERFQDIDLRYREPEPIRLSLSDEFDLALGVRLASIPGGMGWDGDTAINEEALVSIQSRTPRPYEFFHRIVRDLQDFFSVASLRFSPPVHIRVTGSFDPDVRDDGSSFLPYADVRVQSFHQEPEAGPPHPVDFLFRLPDIRDELQAALKAWFTKRDKLHHVRSLYLTARYTPQVFVDSQFLTTICAVEAYHRRFFEGQYLPHAWFELEVQSALAAQLPTSVPVEYQAQCSSNDLKVFRDSAARSLRWLNEYSLRKRLKVLFREFEDVLRAFLPDGKTAIEEIVDARNYLTHWTEQATDVTERPERLAVLTDLLHLVLEVGFLREMGISQERMRGLVGRVQVYRRKLGPQVWGRTD